MLQLLRSGVRSWLWPTGCRGLNALAEEAVQPPEKPEPLASAGPQAPVLRRCELPVPAHRRPVQAWVESLRGYEQERVGLAELHPDVFSTAPRLDILHQVTIWQKNFKRISYAKTKTRAEVQGGGRKPWPQKGSGRARHGSIRSPLWRGGGVAHGPRGPTSTVYRSDSVASPGEAASRSAEEHECCPSPQTYSWHLLVPGPSSCTRIPDSVCGPIWYCPLVPCVVLIPRVGTICNLNCHYSDSPEQSWNQCGQ
uniref:Large ribosomal subunit protein uL4m n=1 Tax=Rousettus aegyptiacus TaxID=9407 RepID=A0A7J8BTE1_ROUAE|nr:mitochondrial ribosomal protein L4 [Rousettus aegyptiacus]